MRLGTLRVRKEGRFSTVPWCRGEDIDTKVSPIAGTSKIRITKENGGYAGKKSNKPGGTGGGLQKRG